MYYIYLDFWVSYDFTWIGYDIWLWTSTELSVAIVCASAPSLKSVFIKFFGETRLREKMRKNICKATGRTFSSNGTSSKTLEPTVIVSQLLDSTDEMQQQQQQQQKEAKNEPTSLWEDITSRFSARDRRLKNKSCEDIETLGIVSHSSTIDRPKKMAWDESWSTYDQSGFGVGGKAVTNVTSMSRVISRASRMPDENVSVEGESMSDVQELPQLPSEEDESDDMVVHVQTILEISEDRASGQNRRAQGVCVIV